jgi:hypothetical protein
VAVKVPFWFVLNAPELIVKVAVLEPAATVTEAGITRAGNPLLASVTTAPPVEAFFDMVTVQVLIAFAAKVVGLHCSEEITMAEARLRLMLCDKPL